MKKEKRLKILKTVAFFLNQICAAILLISVVICTIYIGSAGRNWTNQDQGFEDTSNFQAEVKEQTYRCIRAASRESKFERLGKTETDLVVDIRRYVQDGTIVSEAVNPGGLYYKLTDLLEWSKSYQSKNYIELTYNDGTVTYLPAGNLVIQDQYDMEEITEMAEIAEIAEATDVITYAEIIDNFEPKEIGLEGVQPSEVIEITQIQGIDEIYKPVGYESILAFIEEVRSTENEGYGQEIDIQEVYTLLEKTLASIQEDYAAYEENVELFSPNMTNMRYLVVSKSTASITEEQLGTLAYTNMKIFKDTGIEVKNLETLKEYFRMNHNYIIYDTEDMSYEIERMPLNLSEFTTYLKGYPMSIQGDYYVMIAIDSDYQASDNLMYYKEQFEKVKPLSRIAFHGLILGAILYLLSIIYLTLVTGKKYVDGVLKQELLKIDKIKTEFLVLASILLSGGIYILAVKSYIFDQSDDLGVTCIFMAVFVLIENFIFLTSYLSVVRRVRQGVLIKNSLTYTGVRITKSMIHARKITTRIFWFYLFFLLLNYVCMQFGIWGLLVALLFDMGTGFYIMQNAIQKNELLEGIEKISEGDLNYQIQIDKLYEENATIGEAINKLSEGLSHAVEKSMKDERLKTDLITNVSHDIKTPLTSIISYVGLLKREKIQNERAQNYITILEEKSERLKHLTEDLIEASKISSGNLKLELTRLNFQELVFQMNGEFHERLENRNLKLMVEMPKEPLIIDGDGRRIWRILENVYSNVVKYAMPNTRVYIDLKEEKNKLHFEVKNVSDQPLNISVDELTERFIRGDESRKTEGSGLGLSIALSLTKLHKGSFDIHLDGDLFKVTIILPKACNLENESL